MISGIVKPILEKIEKVFSTITIMIACLMGLISTIFIDYNIDDLDVETLTMGFIVLTIVFLLVLKPFERFWK